MNRIGVWTKTSRRAAPEVWRGVWRGSALLGSTILALGLAASALAQDDGYRIGEGDSGQPAPQTQPAAPLDQTPATAPPTNPGADSVPVAPETSGPVRMARFSYLTGAVTWRPDPQTEWANATLNMPLREGSEIWVGDGGRAELQFDDGSFVRFGSGAVAKLQTLFSDSQGEFTEINLTDGLASMELRTDHSVFQIDTPKGAVKSSGPSRVRVGVDEEVEIGVRQGLAVFDRPQGKLTLNANDYADIKDADSAPQVLALPEEDSWDKFTDERSRIMNHQEPNLPDSLRHVGGDLDDYGSWRDDPDYGHVWAPREPDDWAPYQNGHWVWCEPFGWTWVGAEPWGWAPYHWGSWVHRGWGWGWVPGPVYQFWSPGVVAFSYNGDDICWSPLAPYECTYPVAFGLGTWGFGWSAWFSIGFCGVWSPGGGRYCFQRPWNNGWVNHWHGGPGGGYGGGDHGGGFGGAHPRLGEGLTVSHFQPSNANFATMSANRNNFGDGRYTALSGKQGQQAFSRGETITAGRGSNLVSGPANVAKVNSTSWAGTRSISTRPDTTGILSRGVYRGSNTVGGARSANSSAAEAARQARESIGSSHYSTGGNNYRSNSSAYGRSGGSAGVSHSESSGSRFYASPGSGGSSHGWSVPDRGGWSHVHSDNHASGSGGGSRGGGNGHGH